MCTVCTVCVPDIVLLLVLLSCVFSLHPGSPDCPAMPSSDKGLGRYQVSVEEHAAVSMLLLVYQVTIAFVGDKWV